LISEVDAGRYRNSALVGYDGSPLPTSGFADKTEIVFRLRNIPAENETSLLVKNERRLKDETFINFVPFFWVTSQHGETPVPGMNEALSKNIIEQRHF
jgi:hypothetical protein